jgi:hypothetical protein
MVINKKLKNSDKNGLSTVLLAFLGSDFKSDKVRKNQKKDQMILVNILDLNQVRNEPLNKAFSKYSFLICTRTFFCIIQTYTNRRLLSFGRILV